MPSNVVVTAPLLGSVVSIAVKQGDQVQVDDVLVVLEVMKVQSNIVAPNAGRIEAILVAPTELVEKGSSLIQIDTSVDGAVNKYPAELTEQSKPDNDSTIALSNFQQRVNKSLDIARPEATEKRHSSGYQTARENLAKICDIQTFIEYGQFAVAAQRRRQDYQELQSTTAADGILTGIACVNANLFGASASQTALLINDYSVLAGTQGYFHHKKLDRLLAVAKRRKLPIIMFTEGGGGRPNDTDITTVNSGLQCESFANWAALAGVVPRIAVANGYNFAGNAALFGAADITIATRNSWIGMAGPAMIAGGGLGDFKPKEIGPIAIQASNGVVDIVAEDEVHASKLAKQCLSIFQGSIEPGDEPDQSRISSHLPDNRRFAYQPRDVINTLADDNSFIELKQGFGGAIITGFIRLEGRPIALIANDCNTLGGAIDVDAAEKAADFLTLCESFSLPVLSLCDTPGFMVGPDHEQRGAVRRLTKLFTAGAQLTTPLIAIVLRKCYGLGAQAMVGGSTSRPIYIAAWPTGEFGAMGLEGAVELGYKKQLDAQTDPTAKQQLFDKLLSQAYQRGQATEVASVLEIDAVIDPTDTRKLVIAALHTAN